jgi:DNA-binding transcriptional regulator YhcF (GntR family)
LPFGASPEERKGDVGMQWEINSDRPVYVQLIEQIQAGIISGYFKPGDKLPSVRDLAADAAVNPNTMQKALAELERTGLIYTNRTSGRLITSDTKLIQDLKKQSARLQIIEFIDRMALLGFQSDEILQLIEQVMKAKQKQ